MSLGPRLVPELRADTGMDRLSNNLVACFRLTWVGAVAVGALLFGASSQLSSSVASPVDELDVSPAPLLVPEFLHVTSARAVEMEVTAYCPCTRCCGPKAQGLTASGKRVDYNAGRFIAADTTMLPFGTMVSIPGYHDGEPVEVIDRGGAIKGNKLDVFFPDHHTALEWGRRHVMVFVHD